MYDTERARALCSALASDLAGGPPHTGELRDRFAAMRDYFSDMPKRPLTTAETAMVLELRAAFAAMPLAA